MKDDAVQMIFHELKGTLNGIIGLPQVLLGDDNLTQEQKNMLHAIVDAGCKILDLVNQTSIISKIEQETYAPRPQCFELCSQIQNAMHNARHLALNKGIHLCMEEVEDAYQNPGLWVAGDELCAYFIFSNLIRNAVEASPVNQMVAVGIDQNASRTLKVGIHNQGAVPEAIRDTFFQKYVTSGKPNGTGLGTYTARIMAECQGWGISMTSSHVHGTRVTVTFPWHGVGQGL